MIQTGTKKLTLAAMFFAIGIILPFFIGQIPLIGQMLLPMHIPVLLCGLIVGWQYGLAAGFFLPLVRGMLFGMPALFPNGIGMAFEMATYGLVIGYLYSHSRWQCIKSLYRCLIVAMIAGRLVWGANKTDKDFLSQLEKKYGIEVKCIPDIRVTSGDYGEHTGISASEYQKLTGEKLKLHNHEIYVVYQRNKAEYGTLGIDYGKKEPRLYIGNSDADIWVYTMRVMPGNQFTRDYKIVGTTNRIITGNFKSRQLEESGIKGKVFEEIIVFSDAEYERISKTARGSDLTVSINIPQNYNRVVNDIYKYAEKNSQVNFFDYKYGNLIYEKKELIVEEQEANMLKVSAMIINIITLVICIIFTLYNNIASYKNKMRWKYTFFYRMGMNKVKMKRHLNREILLTTEIACISSIPFAFIMVLIKILYKDLSIYWTIRYIGESLLVVVVLTIVIHFMVYGMANNVKKQIERSIQNEQ